jgi:hypothetical protein
VKFDVESSLGAIWWLDEHEKYRLSARMCWRKEDPAVVHMVLTHAEPAHLGTSMATWVLGREILVRACIFGAKDGSGDVVAEPAHDNSFGAVVLLHLSNETEHLHLLLSRTNLYRFLGETLAFTALDEEDYTPVVDAALERIFA